MSEGGSRFRIVQIGSPLFTGGAGSGESEIHRYLLEHDLVKAIVALPTEMFFNTGIHRSEQYGCEWSWLDFENKFITVPRSKHGEKRRVYLNDAAISAFKGLWRFSAGTGKVFGHLYRCNATVGARGWLRRLWGDAEIKNFRWHDLRHTYASRLVMAGVDIRTVQELMGHKGIQVTLRYAHLAPQHQLQAVQRLCDTDFAPNGPTDTRTDTDGFGASLVGDARPN